jgi:hypothetical protein
MTPLTRDELHEGTRRFTDSRGAAVDPIPFDEALSTMLNLAAAAAATAADRAAVALARRVVGELFLDSMAYPDEALVENRAAYMDLSQGTLGPVEAALAACLALADRRAAPPGVGDPIDVESAEVADEEQTALDVAANFLLLHGAELKAPGDEPARPPEPAIELRPYGGPVVVTASALTELVAVCQCLASPLETGELQGLAVVLASVRRCLRGMGVEPDRTKTRDHEEDLLVKRLSKAGISPERLDALVHDAKGHEAGSLNNQGLEAQVQYLGVGGVLERFGRDLARAEAKSDEGAA